MNCAERIKSILCVGIATGTWSLVSFAGTVENGSLARFMSFNIWGDYFGNPTCEREDGILSVIRRWQPDLLALQEVTGGWWNSSLFPELGKIGYAVVKGDDAGASSTTNYVPILYRPERYRLVESGVDRFCRRLDKSKGMTWAVLQDKRTGLGVIAFSTHFWWQSNGRESDAIRELNARQVLCRVRQLKSRYPFAALGGGDLNSRPGSWAHAALADGGYRTAAEVAAEASALSTHHGDPQRDASGVYRGSLRPVDNTPATSIDHVLVETNCICALKHMVVTDQDALDASDHSPVVVDFTVNPTSTKGSER